LARVRRRGTQRRIERLSRAPQATGSADRGLPRRQGRPLPLIRPNAPRSSTRPSLLLTTPVMRGSEPAPITLTATERKEAGKPTDTMFMRSRDCTKELRKYAAEIV